VSKVFETNKLIINNFISLKDSLLKMDNLSMKESNIIFDEYNSALSSLQDCYDTGMHDSQREAKLADREIEQKIINFNINTESEIYQKDLKGLSKEKLDVILMAMENHLVLTHTTSDNEFANISAPRGWRITRYYPIVLDMPNNDISKGEILDTKIGLGFFAGYLSTQFSVYLDDQKRDMSKSRYLLEIDTDSLGKKRMEAVVVWTNPYTNETSKDTSHFEYTVTP
jgi:hypothetical protein